MSATVDDCDAGGGRYAPPEFALGFDVDDPANPAEVTVYPEHAGADELVTTWISVAVDDCDAGGRDAIAAEWVRGTPCSAARS